MDEESIFAAALEKKNSEQRAAFLEGVYAANPQLREEVESLLKAHDDAGDFLEASSDPESTLPISPITEGPGTRIGRYKLLQQIGEGGMGMVFMAEQQEPIVRKIALKIIKPGMDTRQVIARFEAERQALALMDHPHIAKVLDAGTTDSGRPYFVMELVRGIPITKYCDQKRLTPRDRLELFVPVCQAVQHAHQKGIIHRDIKPSNVLVAAYDGRPVPKMIDFGVAKATGAKLTEKTMFTRFGQVVGTLEYMSPEQAELNQLDIDTRSDIYALGVLLYELLIGQTPFDSTRLRTVAFDEMMRIIREEDPPRPSVRLSSSETLPSIAADRQIEPKKLSELLRGELDWIVMKALEKDRSRRYDTATALANDIQRHLNDEPIVACPPSWTYRLWKLARRTAASLTFGVAGARWQAIRAAQQRDRAVTAESLAEQRYRDAQAARRETEQQLERASAAENLAEDRHQSELQARLEIVEQKERVVRLNRDLLDRQRQNPTENPDTISITANELAYTTNEFAHALMEQDHLKEAESTYREALEFQGQTLGEEDGWIATTMANLGQLLQQQGRYNEAEEVYRELLEITLRTSDEEVDWYGITMFSLGWVVSRQGRYDEAEKIFVERLESEQSGFGNERETSAMTLSVIYDEWCRKLVASADLSERDPCKAVEVAKRAIAFNPNRPQHYTSLAAAQCRIGEWQVAVEAFKKGDATEREPNHPIRMFLAIALWQLGEKEQAQQEYAEGAAWIADSFEKPKGQTSVSAEPDNGPDEEQDQTVQEYISELVGIRTEVEHLMGITTEDRHRLVEEYLASADQVTANGSEDNATE